MRTTHIFAFTALLGICASLHGQALPVEITIRADQPGAHVSPMLYGLMTEEINFSYDGGLYAELIRNRNFKEDAKEPVHWRLTEDQGASASMALDPATPFNDAIPASLKLTVTAAGRNGRAGIANEGFWGIPVHPNTRYQASFYAKSAPGFNGNLSVSIVGNNGGLVQATARAPRLTTSWQKYNVVLHTPATVTPSGENHFLLSTDSPGTLWFGMVSLFPPTYKSRANGNRPDVMELLAGMRPAFLRFPGGNYLEGNTIATRFNWPTTIGDVSQRPGHMDDAWKYWSSDGMGLLEFLNWCEDLRMEPVLAVFAGYALKGERVAAGPALEPYVQEALDEIEYVTGGSDTKWGARRAKDGHPAPFKLEYVEVGNEDQFDREPGSYDRRFSQFYKAIKAKYPQLSVIATAATPSRAPDVIDEHYYRRSEDEMASHAHDYDARPRTGPKVFVGEWATRVGEPTPNMSAALGDAAWMIGMEHNSDLVIMSCYAPLFVNVNEGAMQWKTDLIGYDAMSSYGSPAYYAQQMFSANHGDSVLPIEARGIPSKEWQPPAPRARPGQPTPPTPAARHVDLVFVDATRDSRTGTIYLKVVNRAGTEQPVRIALAGAAKVEAKGQSVTLRAESPDDTNSITDPRKIVPVTAALDGVSADFTRSFPAYSITVLRLQAK